MIEVIVFLVCLFSFGIVFRLFNSNNYSSENSTYVFTTFKLIGSVFMSLFIASANPYTLEVIDVGNIGLKVNNTGNEKGISKSVYVTGWVFYNSWFSRIIEYPVTQQHIDYESISIVTKGGYQVTIKPSLNWSVNVDKAADMYQNLKQDVGQIQKTWLKNAVVGAINDVANHYTIDSIFNKRAEFENAIIAECNKRVSKWFTVSQLRTNILPPEAITKAINAKAAAVQEAQTAMQERFVAEAKAQTKIAIAKGDSAAVVIAAAAQAEVVNKEQKFLTPMYIEYEKIKKWNGVYPTTILGENTSTLLNLNK